MNKFKTILNSIMQELGLIEKVKDKSLTDDDWKNIAQSFTEKTGKDFYAEATMSEEDQQRIEAHDRALQLLNEGADPEPENKNTDPKQATSAPKQENKLLERVAQLQQTLRTQQEALNKLSQETEKDHVVTQPIKHLGLGGSHTPTHAFGIEHPMFDAKKRWNQVAMRVSLSSDPTEEDEVNFKAEVKNHSRRIITRMQELHQSGSLNPKALQEIDYSHLTEADLGEQYVIRRTDALIARIIGLPNVFSIFPLRSFIQDQELITNAFFDEYSQAYQEGEISKGGAELVPEKARVDDAMFKKLFKSMKWIERQYIGYLNTNGSDPTKWGMIEWMLLHISTVLNNERNVRAIRGCRVEPEKGKNGHFLNSSTGIVYRLLTYIEDLKILPFDNEDYADYNATNMVDVVENFVEETHQCLETLLGKALYLNEKHKPWYKQSFRKKYGEQTDFSDGIKVMNYDIPIIWVPNMAAMKFIFIQDIGNLQCLEYIPGEMFGIRFEQRLESVWAYSVWKEGTGAAYSGKKFDTLKELQADNRKHQVIFINKPVTKLGENTTTAKAADNFWFVTSANTQATVFTDIEGAEPGVVYKIEIGGEENATSISKSGKFSELKSAWNPTKTGAWIKVLYDKESDKFKEVDRSK